MKGNDKHGDRNQESKPSEMIDHWKSGEAHSEIFSAEDIANSVSHGVGLGMSIVGLVILLVVAAVDGDTIQLVSGAIYGTTLVLLFAASTVYHSMRRPALRRIFRVVDHSAIYLLIAGTYTPFTLVILPDPWGWTLFGIAWGLATIGVVYKVFWFGRYKGLSLGLYLLMGWTIVVAIKPLWEHLELGGFILMFAGGFFYTAGVIFYAWEKLFFNHAIWHLFVLAAAACHYLAILFYVMM